MYANLVVLRIDPAYGVVIFAFSFRNPPVALIQRSRDSLSSVIS